MNINNARDLRIAYEILGDLNADTRGLSRLKDHADRIKREIRKYHARPVDAARIVRSDYDSLLVVLPLPVSLETKEEADAYFMGHHYRECYPSAYDCTGQIFTTWYKVFRRGGQFWAYHATAMDV